MATATKTRRQRALETLGTEPIPLAELHFRRAEEKKTCWKYERVPVKEDDEYVSVPVLVGNPESIYLRKHVMTGVNPGDTIVVTVAVLRGK